jgi:aspartate beta-hydroxylase
VRRLQGRAVKTSSYTSQHVTGSNSSLDEPAAQAQALFRAGRIAEALRAYQKVLDADPDHVEALNFMGMGRASAGDPRGALPLLERAARVQPDDPITQNNLGLVHTALGDWRSAANGFAKVLRMAPASFVARLHHGQALERLGRADEALQAYFRALRTAQGQGHWRNAETTSPSLRPMVQHAIALVNAGRRRWLDRVMSPLFARFGKSDLQRIEACVAIYLGERAATYADPRQRPTQLYCPGLKAMPYFPKAAFAWAEAFEGNTGAIRQELLHVMEGDVGRETVFHNAELELQNLRANQGRPGWEGYYFFRHGVRREENCSRCPATTAALDMAPLMHVRGLGPEVMFSVLTAGTHLLPHHGVTNLRIVAHLPLVVPLQCALRVGDDVHAWREGELVFFDDTYLHEAWNRSDQTRVVLILDCWNPFLSEAEKAAANELMAEIGAFDRACASDEVAGA